MQLKSPILYPSREQEVSGNHQVSLESFPRLLGCYHVELPGQISERSNSIVFFIKELENIKK
jgi:hypothetical protein